MGALPRTGIQEEKNVAASFAPCVLAPPLGGLRRTDTLTSPHQRWPNRQQGRSPATSRHRRRRRGGAFFPFPGRRRASGTHLWRAPKLSSAQGQLGQCHSRELRAGRGALALGLPAGCSGSPPSTKSGGRPFQSTPAQLKPCHCTKVHRRLRYQPTHLCPEAAA